MSFVLLRHTVSSPARNVKRQGSASALDDHGAFHQKTGNRWLPRPRGAQRGVTEWASWHSFPCSLGNCNFRRLRPRARSEPLHFGNTNLSHRISQIPTSFQVKCALKQDLFLSLGSIGYAVLKYLRFSNSVSNTLAPRNVLNKTLWTQWYATGSEETHTTQINTLTVIQNSGSGFYIEFGYNSNFSEQTCHAQETKNEMFIDDSFAKKLLTFPSSDWSLPLLLFLISQPFYVGTPRASPSEHMSNLLQVGSRELGAKCVLVRSCQDHCHLKPLMFDEAPCACQSYQPQLGDHAQKKALCCSGSHVLPHDGERYCSRPCKHTFLASSSAPHTLPNITSSKSHGQLLRIFGQLQSPRRPHGARPKHGLFLNLLQWCSHRLPRGSFVFPEILEPLVLQ